MSKVPNNMDFVAVEVLTREDKSPIYLCLVDVVNERSGLISFVVAADFSELNSDFYHKSILKNNVDVLAVFSDEAEIRMQLDPEVLWLVSEGNWKSHYFSNTVDYEGRWEKVFELAKLSKKHRGKKRTSSLDDKLDSAFARTSEAMLISSGDEIDKLIKSAYTLGLKGIRGDIQK